MNSLFSTESTSGYGWSISVWQFWNRRGTPEAQRLTEVSSAFSSRSLIWFQLWSLQNPNVDWDTFDLAFLHQYQPDMRPVLPEICWKEVEDWKIEWVEMRAKLLQQPHIDPETTKSQMEQETTAVSAEIQAKIEKNQEIAAVEIQEGSNFRSQHNHYSSKDQQKFQIKQKFKQTDPDTANQQHLSIKTNNYKAGIRNYEVESDEPNNGLDDAIGDFEDQHAGEWTELMRVVVVQRPPPEPPDLNSHAVVEAEREPTTLEVEMREQRLHHHPKAAAVSTEKGRHALLGSGGCGGGEVVATPGSRPKALALRRIFLLNPSPLIVAVFPWNRDREDMTMSQAERERRGEDKVQMFDVLEHRWQAELKGLEIAIQFLLEELNIANEEIKLVSKRKELVKWINGSEDTYMLGTEILKK
ncbi:hypothetical protein PIB30_020455 [Stylosanthes scabra]|uniref:Uncharacterized protein n=1 Tax=Stylosanthes scabra TaxID=79078 RepID=A0ABU6V6S6_9FABA|nr:hypothetical protein [Stylosanthes scabra]